jgi:hypothetical protein
MPPLPKSKVTPNLRVITHLCHYKSNTNNRLNLHINYPIISLLKVKVTPKSESKLYNYNKILKCTNIKF